MLSKFLWLKILYAHVCSLCMSALLNESTHTHTTQKWLEENVWNGMPFICNCTERVGILNTPFNMYI